MRFYATVQRETQVTTSVRCDICWKKYRDLNWDGKIYDINDTSVCMTIGKDYPDVEGPYIDEEMVFDICPTCFKSELIPFIKSFSDED